MTRNNVRIIKWTNFLKLASKIRYMTSSQNLNNIPERPLEIGINLGQSIGRVGQHIGRVRLINSADYIVHDRLFENLLILNPQLMMLEMSLMKNGCLI